MKIDLIASDFTTGFEHPSHCALATALRRAGFTNVNAGTLEAICERSGETIKLIVEGVYINDVRIDREEFGFGPIEYRAVNDALLKDENITAFISARIEKHNN